MAVAALSLISMYPGMTNRYSFPTGIQNLADVTQPIVAPHYPSKTVTCTAATWGTATVIIEGSNDGTNWYQLKDPQGNMISFAANGLLAVRDNPTAVRARVSSGNASTPVIVDFCATCNSQAS